MAVIIDNFENNTSTILEFKDMTDEQLQKWLDDPDGMHEFLLRRFGMEGRALPKLKPIPKHGYGGGVVRNPYHDKKTGKFTSKPGGTKTVKPKTDKPKAATPKPKPVPKAAPKPVAVSGKGLDQEQWDAITPGPGKTAAKARAALAKTEQGKALTEAVHEWQNSMSSCDNLRTNFMKAANGKRVSKKEALKAKALMDGIQGAPISPPLYRGLKLPHESVANLQPGQSMTIGPSSFSSSKRVAGGFAKQKGPQGTTAPVLIQVAKARALPIEVFGDSHYKSEKEWISAGRFVITGVKKRSDGVTVVDVDHTNMFAWNGGES